jgi:DnaJ-class molecular chaperone
MNIRSTPQTQKQVEMKKPADKPKLQTATCPTCNGEGINIAVDDTKLCPDCGGNGTIEVN